MLRYAMLCYADTDDDDDDGDDDDDDDDDGDDDDDHDDADTDDVDDDGDRKAKQCYLNKRIFKQKNLFFIFPNANACNTVGRFLLDSAPTWKPE